MIIYRFLKNWASNIDWYLILAIIPIMAFGLITMNSFVGQNFYFYRQLVWLAFSFLIFFIISILDFKFLRRSIVVFWIYIISMASLLALFIFGSIFSGAQSWLDFGLFSFQPAEFSKLAIIILLAKYFSRRHIEIRNYAHIIISGAYVFILFALILIQPDFGSALIIFFIWFGMVLVSGLSKKHLFILISLGAAAFLGLWFFLLADYQKNRVVTFLNPLEDVQGAGYNAYQSMVSVGSGQLMGKGVGYGTQSRLSFLPEYQTDFIFAAFAEEWGFFGVLILFACYGFLIFRIISISYKGSTNFEVLFGLGVAIMFMSHFVVHVGMNIGLMPITGLTLPFMSYGGSSLLLSFTSLGILMSMKRNSRIARKDIAQNEFVAIDQIF